MYDACVRCESASFCGMMDGSLQKHKARELNLEDEEVDSALQGYLSTLQEEVIIYVNKYRRTCVESLWFGLNSPKDWWHVQCESEFLCDGYASIGTVFLCIGNPNDSCAKLSQNWIGCSTHVKSTARWMDDIGK